MLKEVVEGDVYLKLPPESLEEVSKSSSVFYNPAMELNREVTVAVVRALGGIRFLDLLAASGAKGLRVAREGGAQVALNDINSKAVKLIRENARLNHLHVEVFNKEANLLLNQVKGDFNFIDVDPFGTPVPFLSNALTSVANRGVVSFTATDTAPLCGVYPRPALRKYLAQPLKGELCKEAGLRILIGYAARMAAMHERGVVPLLSHSTRHYFRCFLKLERGARRADEALKEMGYLHFCSRCRRFEVEKNRFPTRRECCKGEMSMGGPLWLGKLKDNGLARRALGEVRSKKAEKLLGTIAGEAEIPFYHDIHSLASLLNLGRVPSMGELRDRVEEKGYTATRAHAVPTALKTDMPRKELLEVMQG